MKIEFEEINKEYVVYVNCFMVFDSFFLRLVMFFLKFLVYVVFMFYFGFIGVKGGFMVGLMYVFI